MLVRSRARRPGLAPADFLMGRQMLRGLKQRAERLSGPNVAPRAVA